MPTNKDLVDLIKIKWAGLLPVSPEFLNEMTLDIHEDLLRNIFFEKLKLVFWGEWAEPTVVARYPANWKEAVKEQFAPSAYLKKHPVVYTEVRAQGGVVFPVNSKLPTAQKIWRFGSEVPDDKLLPEEE
jgi:hypothetical protein